jgi:hypothetical protein
MIIAVKRQIKNVENFIGIGRTAGRQRGMMHTTNRRESY